MARIISPLRYRTPTWPIIIFKANRAGVLYLPATTQTQMGGEILVNIRSCNANSSIRHSDKVI